jgi:hypothetical protein
MARSSLLERPDAVALLEDAEVSAAAVRGYQNRLQQFLASRRGRSGPRSG